MARQHDCSEAQPARWPCYYQQLRGATVPSAWEIAGLARLYRLADGTVEEIQADQLPEIALDQPSLVIVEN